MDIALLILVLVILLIAIVIVIIKFQSHQTSMYVQRMAAQMQYQQTLMLAARAHSTLHGTWLVIGISQTGLIRYAFQPASGALPTTTDNLTLQSAHRAALEIVSESRRQYGGDGKKIIPANQWSSASEWDAAIKHMQNMSLIMSGRSGTLLKDGLTLDDLMLSMAKAVPQAVNAPAI